MARSALCACMYGGERYRGRSCDEVGGARVRMDGFGLSERRGSDQERSVGSGVQIGSNQALIRIVQGEGAVKKEEAACKSGNDFDDDVGKLLFQV